MCQILRQIVRTGIVTEPPPRAERRAARRRAERIQRRDPAPSSAGRWRSARSTRARATAASWRSTRSTTPTTTSRAWASSFVASPRHADMLLVTGPVSRNMEEALRRTYDATPEPKLVVAVGDCGCNGGIFGESYASCGRVSQRDPGRRRGAGLPAAAARDPARHPRRGEAEPARRPLDGPGLGRREQLRLAPELCDWRALLDATCLATTGRRRPDLWSPTAFGPSKLPVRWARSTLKRHSLHYPRRRKAASRSYATRRPEQPVEMRRCRSSRKYHCHRRFPCPAT